MATMANGRVSPGSNPREGGTLIFFIYIYMYIYLGSDLFWGVQILNFNIFFEKMIISWGLTKLWIFFFLFFFFWGGGGVHHKAGLFGGGGSLVLYMILGLFLREVAELKYF